MMLKWAFLPFDSVFSTLMGFVWKDVTLCYCSAFLNVQLMTPAAGASV